MTSENIGIFQKVLILLGSFAITYNIAIALHELGHVIAYLIDGGEVSAFVLNPFSWSWAEANNLNNRIFALWGGVIFGQMLALIPFVLIIKFKSPIFVFLAKLLAACAFLINGLYLTAGSILNFGDGGSLVYLGVSSSLIIITGLIYLLISFLFWSDLQRHIGLDKETAFISRIKVITGGIAPYMILIIIYNLLHNSSQIVMWGGLAIFGILITFLIAYLGGLWSRHAVKNKEFKVVSHSYSCMLLVVGLLVILAEFVVFGTPANPF
jgi:hypothetical protein